MPKYVDGFVIPMPKKNLPAYKKMATLGRKVWMQHGALDYRECIIEHEKPEGVSVPFAKLAKAKPGEVVCFAYIVFKSRAHRDAVNKKVVADPRMDPAQYQDKAMPFDMKRFSYGGFTTLVGD